MPRSGQFDVGCIISDGARVVGNPEKPKTNPNFANTSCVMIITCIPIHIARVVTAYDC
jgi:hypothetical protein